MVIEKLQVLDYEQFREILGELIDIFDEEEIYAMYSIGVDPWELVRDHMVANGD